MSSAANQQTHFYKEGCQVEFSKVQLLTGMKVKCIGVTCDRQNNTCIGCHLGPALRRNVVLQACTEVLNQPEYNSSTGIASFNLRSYKLMSTFVDISTLANLDYSIVRDHEQKVRQTVSSIQETVNSKGGWTVIGWHRRGVVTALEDGTFELNADTSGHLVRVEPTCVTPEFTKQIQNMRYSFTSDT